jgi:hypothetical protein
MSYVSKDLEAYSCMTNSEASPIQTWVSLVWLTKLPIAAGFRFTRLRL